MHSQRVWKACNSCGYSGECHLPYPVSSVSGLANSIGDTSVLRSVDVLFIYAIMPSVVVNLCCALKYWTSNSTEVQVMHWPNCCGLARRKIRSVLYCRVLLGC
jgi:hypothetical protein